MQIKRFEAADMTEALRMVKREFGDDAVILSAKEVRSGGFFGALRKRRVEITAAADYSEADTRDDNVFAGVLSQELDDGEPADRVSLSAPSLSNNPFSRPAQPLPNKRVAAEKKGAHGLESGLALEPRCVLDRVRPALAETIRRGIQEASAVNRAAVNGPVPSPDPEVRVAAPFYDHAEKRKIIALVGPPGAGKSTTAAKLARHCLRVEKQRTGLISLDRFRIGANGMLKKVARIMNLPFTTVHDADGLQSALNDLADVDVVLIDTPGMGNRDPAMLDDVCRLLRLANPDETHLVANATVRADVLAAAVKTFLPLGANRLLFTHMDEYGSSAVVLDLLKETRLPSSFYTDGIDLFDHLQETTAHCLTEFCGPAEPDDARPVGGTIPSAGARVTAFPGHGEVNPAGTIFKRDRDASVKYVANRNSELFHHCDCKSVKRINVENIVAFNSLEQAMNEGFKPCRACCDISMIRETVSGALCYQRASAI
jgi:flagellar biosynthesis protein FlhF